MRHYRIWTMPQDQARRSARHSGQASQNQNGNNKTRSNRELKERGFYSELATIDPDSSFQVRLNELRFILIHLLCLFFLDSSAGAHLPR